MDINNIKNSQCILHNTVKELIISVQTGINTEVSSELKIGKDVVNVFVSYEDLRDILTELGFEESCDFERNGWQNDYWQTFIYNNKEYRLAGCMAGGWFAFSIK